MLTAQQLRQVAARSGARDIGIVEIDVILTHLLQLLSVRHGCSFRSRRQRIRLLVRLNRLTKANPVEVISEKGSSANAELEGILRQPPWLREPKAVGRVLR